MKRDEQSKISMKIYLDEEDSKEEGDERESTNTNKVMDDLGNLLFNYLLKGKTFSSSIYENKKGKLLLKS